MKKRKPRRRKPVKHGTVGGYFSELRNEGETCLICKKFWRERQREVRKTWKSPKTNREQVVEREAKNRYEWGEKQRDD
jgi:hypothetical protein